MATMKMNPAFSRILNEMLSREGFPKETIEKAFNALNGVEGVAMPEVMKRKEAARVCGVSPKAIDKYVSQGLLKRVCFGNAKRATGILKSSVVEMITSASK